jgi:hypothetical protein
MLVIYKEQLFVCFNAAWGCLHEDLRYILLLQAT